MDWSSFGAAIIGAVIGGLIAGYFALRATNKSHENQQKLSTHNDELAMAGYLQAIHDEIETVFDRYQESMGARLESLDDREALAYYYPLVSDFFTVYSGNSNLIGRVESNDLRKQIIVTYTLARGLVDSYRMNNDLVSKWEYSEKLFSESQLEVHKDQAIAHYASLIDYAKELKNLHALLKNEVSALLRELRKNGVLNETGN